MAVPTLGERGISPRNMSRRRLLATVGAVALAPLAVACDTAKSGDLDVRLSYDFRPRTPVAVVVSARAGETPTVVVAGPTATPGARAAAVATEVKSGGMVVDRELKRGERFVTTDEGFVVGDVFVSHPETGELRRMFDDNENSGLIVKFPKGTTIEAPFGADVHMTGSDEKVKEQMMGQAQKDMEDKGCEFTKSGKGCAWVYITTSKGTPQSQVPFGSK